MLEANGTIIEDECYQWPIKDTQHINVPELDALLKVIYLTLKCQAKVIPINTDSFHVYHWVTNALTSKSQLDIKAATKMLIRWQLYMLTSLIDYNFLVTVALRHSNQNQIDLLTRFHQ